MTDKVAVDKTKEVDKTEDFEKRYNDSQAHITKIEAENATFRESANKDKELFDTVSPFIDWDAVNGKKKPEEEDDGYVDKKTLEKTIGDLRNTINQNAVTQNFRSKHPDMVQYEELVGVYLAKTDARRPMDERIDKAVENVKKLIESERVKGREELEEEKKNKAKKEAEVGGLSGGKGPKGEEEPEGETDEEYIKSRKERSKQAMGL